MFDAIEEFFRAHQHTTTALGVVGTFCAVVVSLVLALISYRTSRTRIKVVASISTMLHSTLEGKTKPTYVTAYIRNAGVMPVMIPFSFFHWSMPFGRGAWTANPWDYSQGDSWVPQKKYPVEIKSRSSETFFLGEIDMFRSELRNMFAGANFLERLRFRFLRARVVTDDGKIFAVKLTRPLRNELRALRDSP